MGFFSRFFVPPAPSGSAPYMPAKRDFFESYDMPDQYVVIDLETTGVNPSTCEILEIAAVRYKDGEVAELCHTFLRPDGCIPDEIHRITGINWKRVHDAPPLESVKDTVLSFLSDDVLVGHNVGFDVGFLQTRLNVELSNPCFDTLKAVREVCPYLKSHSLDALRTQFNLGGTAHSALGDCEATVNLMSVLKYPKALRLIATGHVPTKAGSAKHTSHHRYNTFKPSDVYPTTFDFDESHPLFEKTIVFTGELSVERHEVAQLAVNVGAVVRGAVSGKTNFLVVGEQNIDLIGADGMSTKERKAHTLNTAGKADIKVIKEVEFFSLLGQQTLPV